MSEIHHQLEKLSEEYNFTLLHPEERAGFIAANAAQIIACRSVSMSKLGNYLFNRALTPEIRTTFMYGKPTYRPDLNLVVNPEYLKQIVPNSRLYRDDEWIENNAFFGFEWGISELLREGGITEQNALENAASVIYSFTLNFPSGQILTKKQIRQVLSTSELPHSGYVTDYEIMLDEYFTKAQLVSLLHATQFRKGVQIMLGPAKDFLEFIKTHPHTYRHVDDNEICFNNVIPLQYVAAISPLGQYETQAIFQ